MMLNGELDAGKFIRMNLLTEFFCLPLAAYRIPQQGAHSL
jgi:hypothetical protein